MYAKNLQEHRAYRTRWKNTHSYIRNSCAVYQSWLLASLLRESPRQNLDYSGCKKHHCLVRDQPCLDQIPIVAWQQRHYLSAPYPHVAAVVQMFLVNSDAEAEQEMAFVGEPAAAAAAAAGEGEGAVAEVDEIEVVAIEFAEVEVEIASEIAFATE